MSKGIVHENDGLHNYEFDLQPGKIVEMAVSADVRLPPSFSRFMTSPELQSRVHSCTLCYLDPGQRIVKTVGTIEGHLVHFLSDSQSCAHWYLHILPNGDHGVLESPDLYGYQIENSQWIDNPACRHELVDLKGLDFAYCAPSFSDFLYRFWIENEIWFALLGGNSRRPLKGLELDYVNHYKAQSEPTNR